ncbi:MAG: signal peptidase I [Patescibacteria group bacterium]
MINEETTSPTSQNASRDKNSSNFWKELFKLVVISILIVIPFRLYIARPFIVDGASMYPIFKNGQYLIVDEVTYHFQTPERGSVLIFQYPKDTCEPFTKQLMDKKRSSCRKFIKRVIGLPGETVSIRDGKVTIINNDHPNGFTLDELYVQLPKEDSANYIVGQDEYFVMGDNRAASSDSRIWGTVPSRDIIGRPFLRVYPISILPGRAVYPSDISNNNP